MKRLLSIFFALYAVTAFGQYTLTGTVTDGESDAPLPGATLYFPELRKGTTTNESGAYVVQSLPRGTFTVEVKFVGYGTRVAQLTITGDTKLDFTLTSSPTEMHEVVVTGVSTATELRLDPVAIRVLSTDALREAAATNAVDAITSLPGVSQVATGPAISKPVIRGLGYNRVIALYDNIRQEGQQWGDEHGLEIDEYTVDRVEVVKGPGSLMYGSDGIGGVVNFLPPTTRPEGSIDGELSLNYQTNSNLMAGSLMNAGTINGISWSARVTAKQAGNYRNRYDGLVYNSGFHEVDASGFVGLSKSWGYSQLHVTSFDQTLALPEGERDIDGSFMKPVDEETLVPVSSEDLEGYQIGIPSQRVRHFRTFLTNSIQLGDSRLAINAGYQLSRRQEFGDPEEPTENELFFYMPTGTYDVKYYLPSFRGWKITTGVGAMIQSNTNKGEEFLIPDYSLFDIGFFGVFQKLYDRFHLSGGLRYDHRSLNAESLYLDADEQPANPNDPDAEQKFAALDRTFGSYSGSLGVAFDVSEELVVKANMSRGFRAPNLSELTSNGRHEGSFRYELGDRSLEPETSFQLDAGLSFSSDHVTIDVDAFHNTLSNYIHSVKLQSTFGGDSLADPNDPAPVFKYMQGKAILYGGELVIDIHPHPLDWLHFENSFSLVRGRQPNRPDSSTYLPLIPAPRLTTELRASFKAWGGRLTNVFAKVSGDVFFDQNQYRMENNTETATPGYFLLNASAGTDVSDNRGNTRMTIILTASNILDEAYQSHLSRLKYAPENPATGRTGIFDRGRNISIRLIVPLQFRKQA